MSYVWNLFVKYISIRHVYLMCRCQYVSLIGECKITLFCFYYYILVLIANEKQRDVCWDEQNRYDKTWIYMKTEINTINAKFREGEMVFVWKLSIYFDKSNCFERGNVFFSYSILHIIYYRNRRMIEVVDGPTSSMKSNSVRVVSNLLRCFEWNSYQFVKQEFWICCA